MNTINGIEILEQIRKSGRPRNWIFAEFIEGMTTEEKKDMLITIAHFVE